MARRTEPDPLTPCRDGRRCGRRYFVPEGRQICDDCLLERAGVTMFDIEYLYGDHMHEEPVVPQGLASLALARLAGVEQAASPDMRLLATHGLAIPRFCVTDPFGGRPYVRRDDLAQALHGLSGL